MTSRRAPPRPLALAMGLALYSALVVGAALSVALIARSAHRPLPVVPATALLSLLGIPLLPRLARGHLGPIDPAAAAGALAAQPPVLFTLAAWGLGRPEGLASWTERHGAWMLPASLALGALGAALGRRLGAALPAPRIAAAGRIVAACALAAAALITAGRVRAARAPDLFAHLAALPEVARFAPEERDGEGPWRAAAVPGAGEGAPLHAALHCLGYGCGLSLAAREGGEPLQTVPLLRVEPAVIRHDAESRLWIVELPGRREAFREGALAPVKLRAAAVRAELSASPLTALAAAIGVIAALLALARSREHLRRAAAFAAMRQGTLGPDGWVSFDDGSPELRVELSPALPPGPVLAPPAPLDRDVVAYRDPPRLPGAVFHGRKDEITSGARTSAVAAVVTALAALLLPLAPLLAAFAAGLAG